jgi:hypothetical protein
VSKETGLKDNRATKLAIAGSLALALAACNSAKDSDTGRAGSGPANAVTSGATTSSSRAQAIDVCALLTHDEIKQNIKETVAGEEPGHNDSGLAKCSWKFDAGFLLLQVYRPGRARYDAFFSGQTPISGLGDKAADAGGDIGVVKGDTMLELGGVFEHKEGVRPLLEIALSRLK